MDEQRWQAIQGLFDDALALAPKKRRQFVEQAAGGDESLIAEVLALLEADQTSTRLGSVVEQAAATAAEQPIPETIGAYRVVKVLGRGGMGAVYLGQRSDQQFEQQVAIKVVLLHGAGDAIERFRWERQILANLNHPNIAHLHDGGETAEGLPYLVMEYVEGLPIDHYCDEHCLSTHERLELFIRICNAVQHAHKNLVIHRDIKPSNILVTADGKPKLLDFGVAKLLDDPLNSQLTRVGARVMTPEYASPEQVRGDAITTASDVYSLGVLLYRLLSGRSPYPTTGGTLHNIERAILEAEPRKPSSLVSAPLPDARNSEQAGSKQQTPASIGLLHGASPRRLKKTLSGDLDNIVLMAMRKEAELRYGSARAFADDIRAYLNDEPVTAHPASIGYRTRKFVQRNKFPVFGAAATFAVIAGVVSYYTIEVTNERDKAQQVSDFMVSLFERADPRQAQGETITARSLLDEGAARIERELVDQPEVQAEMQDVMGGAYRSLGLYRQSRTLLDQALSTREALFPRDHPDVLETLTKQATLAIEMGDYPTAEALYRRAGAMSQRLNGDEDAASAALTGKLARTLHEDGRFAEAAPLYQDALAVQQRLFPDDDEDKAVTMGEYGRLLTSMGEFTRAEPMLRESVAMLKATVGESHPYLSTALNDLAYALMDTQRWDEAETIQRQAMAISQKVLGDEHPDISADKSALGTILMQKAQYAEAEALFREGLALDLRALEPNHPYVAIDKNNLAGVLLHLAKYEEAEALYRQALEIYEVAVGPEHHETSTTISNLGSLLTLAGKLDEPEELFQRSLAIRLKVFGADNPNTLFTQYYYAVYLRTIGDYFAALPVIEDTIARRQRVLGDGHRQVGTAFVEQGALLRDMERLDAAEDAVTQGLTIYQTVYESPHSELARANAVLASILARKGEIDRAETLYRDAVGQFRTIFGDSHPYVATTLTGIGDLLVTNGQADNAVPLLAEALAIQQSMLLPEHWAIGVTQSVLGSAQSRLGNPAADTTLQRGYAHLEAALGDDARETQLAATRLVAHQQRP